MTTKQLLAAICAAFAIGTAATTHADDLATLNPELAQKRLELARSHVGELATLKAAGFADEEVEHMQHLLLHKIEFARSGKVPAAHQLVAKKAAATAAEMKQLDKIDGLDRQDVERIQHAMLHKLQHLQDETYFVSFK